MYTKRLCQIHPDAKNGWACAAAAGRKVGGRLHLSHFCWLRTRRWTSSGDNPSSLNASLCSAAQIISLWIHQTDSSFMCWWMLNILSVSFPSSLSTYIHTWQNIKQLRSNVHKSTEDKVSLWFVFFSFSFNWTGWVDRRRSRLSFRYRSVCSCCYTLVHIVGLKNMDRN